MANYKHDPDSVIKILKSKIPPDLNRELHAGYRALRELKGKTYREFRDVVGPKRKPDDRKFSPSKVIKHATENDYVSLISKDENNRNTSMRKPRARKIAARNSSALKAVGPNKLRLRDPERMSGLSQEEWPLIHP